MRLEESLRELLQAPGALVAARFYDRLFAESPELQPFFVDTNVEHQAAILTMSLQVVVQHATGEYPATEAYLRVLGHRHQEYGVPRDAYPKFQAALLWALAEFHGERFTEPLRQAWSDSLSKATVSMLRGYEMTNLYY